MVLVVDDDRSTCLVTALALESMRLGGLRVVVETATSSEAAMAILSESTPWVVITDQRMETNDAGERLAEWISTQARLAHVKVIMRTGLSADELGAVPVGVHAVWPKTALDVQGMRRAIVALVGAGPGDGR